MLLKQLSLFLENKTGRLSEVTRVLSENHINIAAFSIADTSDFGILRMIVDQTDVALAALKQQGFAVYTTYVVGFVITNQPGNLYQALQHLDSIAIEIEYLYAFAHNGDAATVIKTNDNELTANTLKSFGYHLLEESEQFNE
jgi:hypothetical protein